jgi:formate hydrogenlyase subunit 6/NADH:ubiquinone oxidoreductase subunit I
MLLVMTKTIIKSLFKKPVTTKYPFAPRICMKNSRGSIDMTISNCIFCGLCQRKCLTDAIVVDKKEHTWQIDRLRCITCNRCVEVCPKKCLDMKPEYSPATTSRKKQIFKLATNPEPQK